MSAEALQRARELIVGKHFAEANRLLESILRDDPGSAEVHFLLGMSHFRSGSPESGEAHFREAARRAPQDHQYVYYHGLALEKNGQTAEALVAFLKANQLKPDFAQAQQKIAQHSPSARRVTPPTPPKPTRPDFNWYTTHTQTEGEPPRSYKVAQWGCLGFILLSIVVVVAFIIISLIVGPSR